MQLSSVALHLCVSVAFAVGVAGCDSEADDDSGAADAATNDESEDDGPQTSRACEGETRDDFALGTERSGERLTLSVMDAMPADPIRGDNVWTLSIRDEADAPMDATISVQPWMPDHGHGTPVQAEVTDLGDGEYEIQPLNLFMAGLWEVHFELELTDGSTDEVVFHACVE